MSKLGKRSLMDNDQLLEGGGGGGGYRSFSKGPQDIRRSSAEERAMVAKKEAEAVRKKAEARVADEARYRADKEAGKIQSTFPIKKNQGLAGQAAKNTGRNKSDMADEMIRLDKMMAAKRDTEKAKARPERQEAERKAVVREEGGVKKTEYPYAGPNEFKKGGMVSASKRADGCCVKGKTKGRMV